MCRQKPKLKKDVVNFVILMSSNEELQCSSFKKHHLLNVLMAKNTGNLFDLINCYFTCSLL